MKRSIPKITIITPSYNQGEFIERTIQSVLSQHYPNLEYLVMDGGSTDDTLKILKKFDQKIKWVSQKDGGQTAAINAGLKKAHGEIVAYLNSDDTYQPGTLKKVAEFFQKHPRANFVYGKGRLIDNQDRELGFYHTLLESYHQLFASCGMSQPTAFWRRKILKKVGLFDESYKFTMDYDYWVRVSQHYRLYFLPAVLANSRIHPTAKTSAFTHKLHAEALRVELSHYGQVHYDWIFTFTDSGYTGKKGTPQYYRYMLLHALVNYAKYNHAVPPPAARRIIFDWLKQAR